MTMKTMMHTDYLMMWNNRIYTAEINIERCTFM